MSEKPAECKKDESKSENSGGWRCDKCGEHFVWHGLVNGRPVCPIPHSRESERR
jgi:formylmethanofuran dehydrogenase subunit E